MKQHAATLPARTGRAAGRGLAAVYAYWPDLLAVAAFAAATVPFFWQLLAQGMVPAGYDLLVYHYPYKVYMADLLRQGQLPLWNPLVFMGVPLLANIQMGVFYPPNLLFYLLPVVDALRYSIVLHVFLAGLFTYLFARVSLRLSPAGAFLAGAVFTFGGYVGGHVGQMNILHSAVWAPILLLCLEQAVSRRSARFVALGALAFAVQLFAGHTQEVYYTGLLLGLFALWLTVAGTLSGRARLWPLGAVMGMAVGAVAVAGVQLLPSLELTRESYRSGGIPFGQAVNYSASTREILSSLLPLYAYAPYVELSGYVAAAALPLIPAALAWKRRSSHAWFFAGAALLALLLSVGEVTPLYRWFYDLVPGFDLFRAPARWLFISNLSLSLLAGIGLDSVVAQSREVDPRPWLGRYGLGLAIGVAALVGLRMWLGRQDLELDYPNPRAIMTWGLFSLGTMALLFVLSSRPRLSPAKIALVGLVMLDLFLAREPLEYNAPVDASLYTAPPPFAARMAEDPSFRELTLANEGYDLPDEAALRAALPSHMSEAEVKSRLNFTKVMRLIPPDTGMAFGINSLDGYDGGVLPTRRFADLKQALLGTTEYHPDHTMREDVGKIPSSRTLGAFGVRYLLLNENAGEHDPGWTVVTGYVNAPLQLLRNSVALPRAYLVHDADTLPDDARQLQAVLSSDLSRTVVLADPVQFERPTAPATDSVKMVGDAPNEVTVDVVSDQPGFLVLSDSYYPGWRVYVDGQDARLLRANYAVRAVQLPTGSHTVRFSYEPLSVRLGLALSALGLILVVSTLFTPLRLPRLR